MLADSEIRRALGMTDEPIAGDLHIFTIDPGGDREPLGLEDWQIQPVSVDLLLGDIDDAPFAERVGDDPWTFTLPPGWFCLGSTMEYVEMPATLAGIVAGKSSIARRGLQVEAAGLVDPGFRGQLTLELVNLSGEHIDVVQGEPICQIYFHRVDGVVERPYGSKGLRSRYQGQRGPTPARPDPIEEGPTT